MSFTVSIEELDGEFHLCPVGYYPPGFMDIGGFDSAEAAEAWLTRWAESRRLQMTLIESQCWRVTR